MKNVLLSILLLFPLLGWTQRELLIEGPNDKVAAVTLQVKSDFDPEKGLLKLTIVGDDTDECNALCLLQEATTFGTLEKYFKQQESKLKVSSFAKEQMGFMNLTEKTAQPVIQITGAQLVGNPVIQTKSGVKVPIQKQILPLDNRSTLVLNLQVAEGVEEVRLDLRNPLLLVNDNGKYELAFIGNDVSMDFSVVVDHCSPNACLLDQLQEYNDVFAQGEAALLEAKTNGDNSLDKMKSLLISEFSIVDLKRFEKTQCQDIEDALSALKDLMERVKNITNAPSGGGGGGGGGNAGQAGAPAVDDCNFKKTNEDLRSAVVKLNTYANDWMSATDPAVKQAKKVAFDSLIKETDAKLNALQPACRKKLDSTSLKNYEMAKKLIKN